MTFSHVQDITIIKHLLSTNLWQKTSNFFGHISNFYFIVEFQNCESEHDHGLLWIKDAPMYKVHTNEEFEEVVNMYISCQVSLLLNLLQNAQHQHTPTCKKNNNVVCRFHYPLPPICVTKNLEPFQINGNCPISQQYFYTQSKFFLNLWKILRKMKIYHFLKLLFLNFGENTYISNLRSKLTKLHIFKNKILKT